MSGADLAAVVVAIVTVLALAVISVAFWSILQTMRRMTSAIEDLQQRTVPVMASLQATIDTADAELQRVDGILDTAENISGTVESASRLTYLAISNPLIKGLAFLTGATRGFRRLRRGR